ncbi:hypothetical protein F4804DRAFT_136010 [Jackrogersella minutella]|nr:hypothetical protein F4804DRAFT_136010 [Jackrogersella minutella]
MSSDLHQPSSLPAAGEQNFSQIYDSQAGQACLEQDGPMKSWTLVDWHRRQHLEHRHGRSKPGEKGTRSLVDTVIEVVCENLRTAEMDTLDGVPIHLVRQVWDYMDKNAREIALLSFMLLSKSLTREYREYAEHIEPFIVPAGLYKHYCRVSNVVTPLTTYTKPLMPCPFDFIIQLSIEGNGVRLATDELLKLTELKNLGVLRIIQPNLPEEITNFPRVSDATISHWSEQPDPFPLLRVLQIWGSHFTTTESVQYLTKFPALMVYDVAGNRSDWAKPESDSVWDVKIYRSPLSPSAYDTIEDCCGMLKPETAERDSNRLSDLLRTWGRHFGPRRHQVSRFWPSPLNTVKTWYLLYCYIGQVCGNDDLVAKDMHDPEKTYLLEWEAVPQRPFIQVDLGRSSDPVRGLTYCMYVRKGYGTKVQDDNKKPASIPQPPVKAKRRNELDHTARLPKKQKIAAV